jgi:hypothetical protein
MRGTRRLSELILALLALFLSRSAIVALSVCVVVCGGVVQGRDFTKQ